MDAQAQDDVSSVQLGTAALEVGQKAELDQQIATAKKFPRNISAAKENAIAVATMDMETAQSCGYNIPRAGKMIDGKSTHLAKIIAQQWGNLRLETKVISIDHRFITSQAIAFDLETNIAIKVEAKRSILDKKGRMSEYQITGQGMAASSIALRNAIFTVVPQSVSEAVYKATRQKIVGDVSDKNKLIAKRQAVIDGFRGTYGVTEQDLLKVLGLRTITEIKEDQLSDLIGIGQGLKDKEFAVDEIFSTMKGIDSKTDLLGNKTTDSKKEKKTKGKKAKKGKQTSPLEDKDNGNT